MIETSELNWDRLRIFYWVVKSGSFSQAAKKLCTSQPAISHHIASLERSLGLHLFLRIAHGVTLTPEGSDLYRTVQNVFQEITSTVVKIKEDDQTIEGEIKVAASSSFSSIYLVPKLAPFLKEHPRIRLTILGADDDIDPTTGVADIVIRPKMKPRTDLTQSLLLTMHMRLYATIDYLNKFGNPENLDDLDKHRLIAYGYYTNHPYADLNWHLTAGMPEGKTREPYFVINTPTGRSHFMESGLGILLLPNKHPSISNSNVINILPKERGPKIDLYCIYHKRIQKLKKIVRFLEFLQASFT